MKTKDFFSDKSRTKIITSDHWAYFDYKYMHTVLSEENLAKFSWEKFGFPGRDGRSSTLWVGTGGAHTPCHQDTYGTNLVAQLVGTKTWVLFPPDQGHLLKAGRLPYEESSVYSQANLSRLDRNSWETLALLDQTTPYLVTLYPGEVLYVPRHWWHQVTCQEWSISVNTWLEHPGDHKARLKEALVRLQVAGLVTAHGLLDEEEMQFLLNTNETKLAECGREELVNICKAAAKLVKDDIEDSGVRTAPQLGDNFVYLKPSKLDLANVTPLGSAPTCPLSKVISLVGEVTSDQALLEAAAGLNISSSLL